MGDDSDSPSLATFGETMLRYTPTGDERLETSETFAVHTGGAESNVAVAAARLGLGSAWLSRLPDTPLGRRIAATLRRHGVDPLVDWTDGGRVGTYYLEPGGKSRTASVTYDRAGTPVREATPADLATEHIARADAFHTTGITPALAETLAETTGELLALAGEHGTTRVFDVNYRGKLWSPAAARDTLSSLLDDVDVLIVADRDAETIFEFDGDAASIAREFTSAYDLDRVVVTQGETGATALFGGETFTQSTFESTDRYPVGTGDAFVGGFLASYLRGELPERALSVAAATAALKREIPGDLATVDPPDVESLLDSSARDISR
jgi:2-dehydro-3-deoxygluconokinase